MLGSTVDGRYEVVELLGEGGTGRVYKVRHTTLDRFFAMKLLRRDLARDEELTARFIQEAKATATVQHPHVVEITDFGKLPDGVPFLVMELLVGRTLGDVIKTGGPLPPERAARILKQIASALAAAHAVGIVHRDLKPDNVFLLEGPGREGNDAVRIVDFGAAKVVGASRVTRDGIIFGTPHYMSPEQASGQPVDHRADIYSLGVIMYEMFTGRVPFEADTYMGVLTQHMFVKPVPPSQVSVAARDIGALEEITLVCLAKKPEDRYPSMDRLGAEIERTSMMLGSVPPSGSTAPEANGAPTSAGPYAATGDVEAAHERSSLYDAPLVKRAPPWGWLAAGALLFGLLVGVLAWLGRREVQEAHRLPQVPRSDVAVTGPTAIAEPPTPVPAIPPSPTIAPAPSATAAASEGEARAAAPAPRGSHEHARRPAPRKPTTIDDVGDPFAVTR